MEFFKLKRANFEKLKSYGFKQDKGGFVFKKDILDGELEMIVSVSKDGEVVAKVYDKSTSEEFVLHLAKEAVGAYAMEVRSEFENVLQDVADRCFDRDVFKNNQTQELIAYIREKYGCELEYLWEKFPTDAIWRRQDSKKWFGVLMTVSKRKLGFESDEMAEVVDLRVELQNIDKVVDGKGILQGYHMNKKHWITVVLNGTVENRLLFELVDKSFLLAIK